MCAHPKINVSHGKKKNKLGDNVRNCTLFFFYLVATVIRCCAAAAAVVAAAAMPFFEEKQREMWISILSQFDGSVLRPIANTRSYINWRNVHQHATGMWYWYMLLHLRPLNYQIGSELDSVGFCHSINLTVNFLVIIKSEYWTVRKCAFALAVGASARIHVHESELARLDCCHLRKMKSRNMKNTHTHTEDTHQDERKKHTHHNIQHALTQRYNAYFLILKYPKLVYYFHQSN